MPCYDVYETVSFSNTFKYLQPVHWPQGWYIQLYVYCMNHLLTQVLVTNAYNLFSMEFPILFQRLTFLPTHLAPLSSFEFPEHVYIA